jgi:DNA-directed RNA polymerase subunit M/transcription elongation factor TFIIS
MNETQTITDTATMASGSTMAGSERVALGENHYSNRLEIALEAVAPPCPKCGSHRGQWRGFRQRTKKAGTVHRRWCTTCGHWHGYKTSMR